MIVRNISIKREIFEREKTIVKKFFNLNKIPEIPDWIMEEKINHWNKNLFHLHYLPKISLDEELNFPLWKRKNDKPHKVFYKKIREGELPKEAKILTGKWILIDGRNKPKKRVPWIRINDVRFLEKLGFHPKNFFKQWGKQIHQDEYLGDILAKKGFGSRFCLNIQEIESLKPFILDFLKINSEKNIRLPFFIEYNYLANTFYSQWRKTETWEWFEDKLQNGQYLAGGSKSAGCLGWEPPQFWSTILTFRPVLEL